MVNTDDSKLIFFDVYRADAGHNYGAIEGSGFAKALVQRNGKPTLIDNPRYG